MCKVTRVSSKMACLGADHAKLAMNRRSFDASNVPARLMDDDFDNMELILDESDSVAQLEVRDYRKAFKTFYDLEDLEDVDD